MPTGTTPRQYAQRDRRSTPSVGGTPTTSRQAVQGTPDAGTPPVPTSTNWAHDPYQHYQLLRDRTKIADNLDEIQSAVSIVTGVFTLL